MPLSKDDQRTLDEMERALRADDPTFAGHVDLDRVRLRRRVVPSAVFVVGLALLLTGAVLSLALVAVGVLTSVLGFLVMTASALVAPDSWHRG